MVIDNDGWGEMGTTVFVVLGKPGGGGYRVQVWRDGVKEKEVPCKSRDEVKRLIMLEDI